MRNVDSLDRSILSYLRESARAPYVDIAKSVGVTERTVRTRIKKLEDDGIIRGYTVREAGIGLTALIRLKVGSGTEIGKLAVSIAIRARRTLSVTSFLDSMENPE